MTTCDRQWHPSIARPPPLRCGYRPRGAQLQSFLAHPSLIHVIIRSHARPLGLGSLPSARSGLWTPHGSARGCRLRANRCIPFIWVSVLQHVPLGLLPKAS